MLFLSPVLLRSKSRRLAVQLVSAAETGFFYTSTKSPLKKDQRVLPLALHMLRNEGVTVFYAGLGPALLMAPAAVVQYTLMDPLRGMVPLFMAAAIAGSLDITLKCPFDNLKTKLHSLDLRAMKGGLGGGRAISDLLRGKSMLRYGSRAALHCVASAQPRARDPQDLLHGILCGACLGRDLHVDYSSSSPGGGHTGIPSSCASRSGRCTSPTWSTKNLRGAPTRLSLGGSHPRNAAG